MALKFGDEKVHNKCCKSIECYINPAVEVDGRCEILHQLTICEKNSLKRKKFESAPVLNRSRPPPKSGLGIHEPYPTKSGISYHKEYTISTSVTNWRNQGMYHLRRASKCFLFLSNSFMVRYDGWGNSIRMPSRR